MNLSPSSVPCGAVIEDNFCIDCYGDIYKCMLAMQNKDCIIGNIETAVKDDRTLINKKHIEWIEATWNDECSKCELLPLCHSGCLYLRKESGKKKICTLLKNQYKEIVKLKFDYFNKMGEN